jgi:hypothetical protein
MRSVLKRAVVIMACIGAVGSVACRRAVWARGVEGRYFRAGGGDTIVLAVEGDGTASITLTSPVADGMFTSRWLGRVASDGHFLVHLPGDSAGYGVVYEAIPEGIRLPVGLSALLGQVSSEPIVLVRARGKAPR